MALSHFYKSLSISALLCTGIIAVTPHAGAGTSLGSANVYLGRWTVDEDRPVFSSRGKIYKTIDVAPCGTDFCGVSVSDNGACGPTLFRFRSKRPANEDSLKGHAKWGNEKKNIVIYGWDTGADGKYLELYVGDGYDFGGRSESMPKFQANYRPLNQAKCVVR
jgi:hypothetical protein